MEWMLQIADEIDDAVGAWRLSFMSLRSEIGLLVAGSLGFGSICAAIAAGAEMQLIVSAALVLSLAATLKFHRSPS